MWFCAYNYYSHKTVWVIPHYIKNCNIYERDWRNNDLLPGVIYTKPQLSMRVPREGFNKCILENKIRKTLNGGMGLP